MNGIPMQIGPAPATPGVKAVTEHFDYRYKLLVRQVPVRPGNRVGLIKVIFVPLVAGNLGYDLLRKDIQRMFLPDPHKKPFPRYVSFAHMFLPEMEVGGDYYDLKALDDRRVAVLIADVAGHGMSAAFVTGHTLMVDGGHTAK
jgi:serine phosphatase RsbU (regulator of sigma subunit)